MEMVAKGGLTEYILSFHFCLSTQVSMLENLHFHVFDAEYFSASETGEWHVWCSLQLFLMISLDHPQLTIGRCDLLFASVNFAKLFSLINTQESLVHQYVFAF